MSFLSDPAMFNMTFVRIFLHFYDQVRHKAGDWFYSPTKNNKPMKVIQTKKT